MKFKSFMSVSYIGAHMSTDKCVDQIGFKLNVKNIDSRQNEHQLIDNLVKSYCQTKTKVSFFFSLRFDVYQLKRKCYLFSFSLSLSLCFAFSQRVYTSVISLCLSFFFNISLVLNDVYKLNICQIFVSISEVDEIISCLMMIGRQLDKRRRFSLLALSLSFLS